MRTATIPFVPGLPGQGGADLVGEGDGHHSSLEGDRSSGRGDQDVASTGSSLTLDEELDRQVANQYLFPTLQRIATQVPQVKDYTQDARIGDIIAGDSEPGLVQLAPGAVSRFCSQQWTQLDNQWLSPPTTG